MHQANRKAVFAWLDAGNRRPKAELLQRPKAYQSDVTFEEKIGLDKMNDSRIQSGTHNFTMRPLAAMGVGLKLRELTNEKNCRFVL